MLKKLCCSKSDQADGHESPARPASLSQKGNGKAESAKTPTNINADASSPVAIPEKPTKRDLWKEAFDSLPDNRKRYLPSDGSSSTAAVDNVITETKDKYEEWKNGGLKIRKKDGSDFSVRDSAEKILNSAMQFKDLISTAVSFDPTGHASSAWTIVSLGLSMVQNGIGRRDAIFAASGFLAETLAYYSIVDAHHRDQDVDSDQNLDESLLQVYSAILDYSAEVKKAQQENIAMRFVNSIIALADQPLAQLKTTVAEKGQGADRWAHLSNDLRNRQDGKKILGGIDEAVDRIKNVQDKTLSAEEERILAWVSTVDYSTVQKEIQQCRTPETGNWFLVSEHYESWKNTSGNILWLHGIVGCGKSVLCSTIIHDIEQMCAEDPSKSFAYWYFRFSNNESQSVENMVRSLIRQFSQKPLAPSVISVWEQHSKRGSQPDWKTLSDTLNDVLSNATGEMFLILDALDECLEEQRHKERTTLLALLLDLAERHNDKLHILATSRPEKDIHSALLKFPAVDLQARLAEDVETFVRAKVSEGILSDYDEQLQARIIDGLLRTGERRFRWADLQITRLADCLTDEEVEDALRTIPKTLEDTYRAILDKVKEQHHGIVSSILIMMCFSAVPLDLATVAATASLRAPDMVIKICTSSLVTSNAYNTVKLAHFSVKEFLVIKNDADNAHWCRFSAIKGQTALAEKTIDLLLAQPETLTEDIAMNQPLLVYAAKYWQAHVAALDDMGISYPALQGKIDHLFTDPNTYFNWVRIAGVKNGTFGNPWHMLLKECEQPLHRASRMGLTRTVDTLLARGANPLISPMNQFEDPLGVYNTVILAAGPGHLDTVEMLLSKNLEISERSVQFMLGIIDSRNAEQSKLEAIVKILWDQGFLTVESKGDTTIKEDMMMTAIGNQYSGLELVNTLLNRRNEALVPITGPVLQHAIFSSHYPKEMVELLFDRCNDDIRLTPSFFVDLDKEKRTPARPGGMEALMRRRGANLPLDESNVELWARIVDSNSMRTMLQTRPEIRVTQQILEAAASNWYGADMIRFLFDRREPGTEINETLLLIAVENDNGQDILNFLLENFALDASMTETLILAAVDNSNSVEKVQVVLEKLHPDTPLTPSVMELLAEAPLSMMQMVLERQQAGFVVSEAVIKRAVSHDEDPLEMVQLLMNNGGFDIPITEEILCEIAEDSCPPVMQYFIDLHGHSLPITENVLVTAARSGSVMFEMLFKNFPQAQVSDRLFEAASWDPNVLLLLLKRSHDNLPIHQMVFKIGQRSGGMSGKALQILLEQQLVQADEELVETVARNESALAAVFTYKPDVPITHKALVRAAGTAGTIRLLLDKLKDYDLITENVMIAAARSNSGRAPLESIFNRLGSAPVTDKLIKEALIYGASFVPEFLIEKRPDLDAKAIFADIWQNTDIEHWRRMCAIEILQAQTSLEVSDSALSIYPYDWEQKKDYDLDGLIICLCSEERIPLTEVAAEIVVERCGNETIERFLEVKSNIPITVKMVQAAERNPRADRERLLSLLAEKNGSL